MAVHGFVFLGTTIGMPIAGWICDVAGPRAGMATAAVSALAVAAPLPGLRQVPISDVALDTQPPP